MKIKGYYIVGIEKKEYTHNGNMAIELMGEQGPFAIITTNTDKKLKKGEALIDTNNCPWAEEWLVENEFGEPTGEVVYSGFCVYPVYKINEGRIFNNGK